MSRETSRLGVSPTYVWYSCRFIHSTNVAVSWTLTLPTRHAVGSPEVGGVPTKDRGRKVFCVQSHIGRTHLYDPVSIPRLLSDV